MRHSERVASRSPIFPELNRGARNCAVFKEDMDIDGTRVRVITEIHPGKTVSDLDSIAERRMAAAPVLRRTHLLDTLQRGQEYPTILEEGANPVVVKHDVNDGIKCLDPIGQ